MVNRMKAGKLHGLRQKIPGAKKIPRGTRYANVGLPAEAPSYSKPWVDWLAGRIQDPVTRLRFLQAVAPAPERVRPQTGVVRLLIPGMLALALTGLCLLQAGGHVRTAPKPAARAAIPRPVRSPAAGTVWLVEKTGASEVYSNGLRIDDRFRVSNGARSYLAFPRDPSPGSGGVRRTEVAGVVFHATQSPQAPFEADQNGVLKKIGESLLEYIRRKRAYHFLIDRFGRVYRVVAETDAANHAGYSVWSDERWLYLNLNQSFLGVAIEAWSRPADEAPEMSPAQLRSAGMLIEMLRNRYHIPGENCVTHAQVSVNPANMQIGYHTDWASGFPFGQLGLADNYLRPPAAVWAFGFEANPDYLKWAGHRLAMAVEAAEAELGDQAEQAGRSPRAYRRSLQQEYRERLAAAKRARFREDADSEP